MTQIEKHLQLRDLLLEKHNLDLYKVKGAIYDTVRDEIVMWYNEPSYPNDNFLRSIQNWCINYLTDPSNSRLTSEL